MVYRALLGLIELIGFMGVTRTLKKPTLFEDLCKGIRMIRGPKKAGFSVLR